MQLKTYSNILSAVQAAAYALGAFPGRDSHNDTAIQEAAAQLTRANEEAYGGDPQVYIHFATIEGKRIASIIDMRSMRAVDLWHDGQLFWAF